MADTVSVLTGGSNNKTTTAEEINAPMTDLFTDGIVGTFGNTAGVAPMTGGLACNAQGSPNMTVAVTAGKAYVTCTPTSQGSQRLRANIAAQNATIAANATGGTRYDWIYVSMSASGAANPVVDGTGVASITVSRSTSSATDNGTPPTYGYCIAVVTVANGAASITNGNITDRRSTTTLSATTTTDGWITAEATPNTVTANGNRSYDLVFNSLDLTDTLSPGMRLKTTRTSTAPTQCTTLNGTTQYFKNTAPASMTFTDDFTVSAWIKVAGYPAAGSIGTIASRSNNTSGWYFAINEYGQLILNGINAAIGNYSRVTCHQSVPLNRWVHVAAQLDMSTFTATTTTSYVMIDGLDVPAAVTRAGTNPTALIQAGDLNIGSFNSGSFFFNGSIAQAAIYNAKVTQSTILASMNQTLTGSETSLVSGYTFNNVITDLTGNNTLTAVGSAVATTSDSPFTVSVQGVPTGTTDYAVITKTAFSTNSTITVQVPEGNTIPTTGGVSALSYSTQEVPYGFILNRLRWRVTCTVGSLQSVSIGATTTYYPALPKLSVPVGRWTIGYDGCIYQSSTVSGLRDPYYMMATSTPTYATTKSLPLLSRGYENGTAVALGMFARSTDLSNTSVQTYFMYGAISAATGTEAWLLDGLSGGVFIMYADCEFI